MAYPKLRSEIDSTVLKDEHASSAVAEAQSADLDEAPGLCLSGGGYRATLFHIGSILRLNECGLLSRIKRISSVSGGSITNGALAVSWENLTFDAEGVATNLEEQFVAPLLSLTSKTIDVPNILLGFVPGISAPRRVAKAYDKFLFKGKTLQDIPDEPVFVFNATNMHSGVLWRFSKTYAADYRIGMIYRPDMALSQAVGASSAFPPILSPVKVNLSAMKVVKTVGADLHEAPYTEEAALTDGGVYDNLGMETVYKRHRTVFVSNGGGSIPDFANSFNFWSTQLRRIITIMNGQHDSLRIRQLIEAYKTGQREGAYWGLNSKLKNPIEVGGRSLSNEDVRAGEAVRTRLNSFSIEEQTFLIHLGYALCDDGLRNHYNHTLPKGSLDMRSINKLRRK